MKPQDQIKALKWQKEQVVISDLSDIEKVDELDRLDAQIMKVITKWSKEK